MNSAAIVILQINGIIIYTTTTRLKAIDKTAAQNRTLDFLASSSCTREDSDPRSERKRWLVINIAQKANLSLEVARSKEVFGSPYRNKA